MTSRPWYPRKRDWFLILTLYGLVNAMQIFGLEAHHWCVPGYKDIGETEYQCGEAKYAGYSNPKYEQTVPGQWVPVIGFTSFIAVIVINVFVLWIKSNEFSSNAVLNHIEICLRMLLLSSGSTLFINSVIKLLVGRPRPNFYALMETDNAENHRAARRSFPSGHSAYSASMLYLLTLNLYAAIKYVQRQMLKGRRIRVCPTNPHSYFFGHDWKVIWHHPRVFVALTFVPAVMAAFIACSRIYDRWHHISDVCCGMVLGMAVAKGAYRYFKAELEWKQPLENEYQTVRPMI